MNQQEQSALTLTASDITLPVSTQADVVRPRLGLQVDLHTTPPGLVEIAAGSDHRLLVHAGTPTHGVYQGRPVLYTRGDIDLFPAGVAEVWEASEMSSALLLQITPALLQWAAQETGRALKYAGLDLRCQFRDPQIEYIAWTLDAEHRVGYPNGLLYTESLGLALAVHLLGGYAKPVRQTSGLSKQQLQEVISYIEEHLDQDLSLAVLASVANVSVSHLKTLFRRSTGLPVHEYVIQRRVERAKVLLTRGELPASQVALEAGFAHQSHMARWMRRILGVTPASLMHCERSA